MELKQIAELGGIVGGISLALIISGHNWTKIDDLEGKIEALHKEIEKIEMAGAITINRDNECKMWGEKILEADASNDLSLRDEARVIFEDRGCKK